MANILILGVKVPFTPGGQEVLVSSLRRELKSRGHEVDSVELPFSVLPKETLLNQAAIWRSLDLTGFAGKAVDLVIATKFPSYYARHPRKSLWLVHQHRPAYDLFGSQYSDFSDDPRDEALRRMLVKGDSRVIYECSYRAGISQNVVNRLRNYNGLDAETLYPPLPLVGKYQRGESKDYILSVGRLCGIKRVDMMLKALPYVHNFIKLKITGLPDEPGIMDYFKNEMEKHHITSRVEFLGRVEEAELLKLYSEALAVYYAPHNEDYGYVTLEAFASGKPVVTATDSGGVLEFVQDEKNGLVVVPEPIMVGLAINRLVEDRKLAESLGEAGYNSVKSSGLLDAGWDNVIDRLLSPLKQPAQNADSPQAVG